MAKWFIIIFMCWGSLNLSAQCDSLKLDNLERMLTFQDMLPTLKYVKLTFGLVAEDSLAYFYGRCEWDASEMCYPYKEYIVQSKSNLYYMRYQCYDLNTFLQIQKQIEAIKVIQTVQEKEYRTIFDKYLVNYMESPIDGKACPVQKQYMIEFLRFK